MSKTVRYEVDLNNLPPLTEAQKAEIETLAAMPDDQIDTSDIPELTEAQWAGADRGRFYRPIKQQITARLDADVLAWFKEHAPSGAYQTEINRELRRHVVEVEKQIDRQSSLD